MKIGILFDLDGTLLDTLEDLKDAVNYALTYYGCPTRTLDQIRSFVGNGVKQLLIMPSTIKTKPAHIPEFCRFWKV